MRRVLVKRNVRVRLRYVLPAAQMLLAMVLYWRSDVWVKWAMRLYDMPGPAPAFTLLTAVNVPLALPRAFLDRYLALTEAWGRVAFVGAIGLLWYWAALNVDSWRQRRTVVTFSWIPLRLATDLLLIATGALWGCIGVQRAIWHLDLYRGWPLFVTLETLYIAWSAVLVFFFGRDLLKCLFGKKPFSAA